MELGQVLLALRLERKLTQEQVALEAGTDAGHVSRIEKGQKQPSLDMLARLAAALGSSRSALFAAMEAHPSGVVTSALEGLGDLDYSPETIQLRALYRELSLENRKLAVRFLRCLNQAQREE